MSRSGALSFSNALRMWFGIPKSLFSMLVSLCGSLLKCRYDLGCEVIVACNISSMVSRKGTFSVGVQREHILTHHHIQNVAFEYRISTGFLDRSIRSFPTP